MTDREKVILGLEQCANYDAHTGTCDECPYGGHGIYGCAQLARDALELLRAQPEPQAVTLADMLVIRARFFMNEEDCAKIKRRLEEQIRNGDRVLILPDYMEPVIIPKDTEVHIETEPIGVFPGRINPSLSVNPPRIVPKNDKRGR